MSKSKQLYISKSVTELKRLLANRSVTIFRRIRMLILIKSNEGRNFSKRTRLKYRQGYKNTGKKHFA